MALLESLVADGFYIFADAGYPPGGASSADETVRFDLCDFLGGTIGFVDETEVLPPSKFFS